MTGPLYDDGEVRLIDALIAGFGWDVFRATLNAHPDARPFQAEGRWRIRLGQIELWIGDDGQLSFGVERAGALHTGTVRGGVFQWDERLPLAPPHLN